MGKGVKIKACYIKAKQFLEGHELLLASASRRNNVLAVLGANRQSTAGWRGSLGVSQRWVRSGRHMSLAKPTEEARLQEQRPIHRACSQVFAPQHFRAKEVEG